MTTLANLETTLARRLRDTGNSVWGTAELDDFINAGIDEIADFYPKEVVSSVATVSASTFTYAVSSYSNIYRVDFYTSAGSYKMTMPPAIGDTNSGWELHNGILYLPPSYAYTTGDVLQVFGYGRFIQLSASSQTTDLDQSAIWALMSFCQAEAFGALVNDIASFQEWQAQPGNNNVTPLALAQLANGARTRWRDQQRRLRRMRQR